MTYFALPLKYLKNFLKILGIEEKKSSKYFICVVICYLKLSRKRKVISETVFNYLQVIFIIKKYISNCLKALLSLAL